MEFLYQNNTWRICRYPQTSNNTLRAWSAADEHILNYLKEQEIALQHCAIYNDRFGFLSLLLHEHQPKIVLNYASQQDAIQQNFEENAIPFTQVHTNPILQTYEGKNLAILKVPKSLDMFRLYLHDICKNTTEDTTVVAGFMTKYFTPQLLSIASDYFETVTQSRAWKKSRLLILKGKKPRLSEDILHRISFQNKIYQQYWGVFSAGHIDYATQFFLTHLQVQDTEQSILDLASGNGIIAAILRQQQPKAEIHLVDDSYLATASSKLNITDEQSFHHCHYKLEQFETEQFDLVVSNPPFHFGHEIDISVPLSLFQQVERCLKYGGRFLLVANRHLNYKTHLWKSFHEVEIVAQNSKFIVYSCLK